MHDQVTLDPAEAAHAVEESDDEDDEVAKPAYEHVPPAEDDEVGPRDEGAAQTQDPTSPTSPISPSKRDSRVKSWFKKFRSGSKTENDLGEKPAAEGAEPFTATYTTVEPIRSVEEEDKPTSDSIRDVALAGRKSDVETDDMYGGSSVPEGRVSPVHEDTGPGPAVDETLDRPVSPLSDSSELSEDPYVIAADVASSRYSAEHGSKRDSGIEQAAALSDSDSEPRGRKGFRERFLKKVIPGRDKDKQKSTTEAPASVTSDPIAEETSHAATEPHANPDPQLLAETEPLREKIQEPSTTSTEAANTTTTGATTPALTHAQTNGDDEDDFEEARDTFDEQRLGPPPKLVDVSGATTETPRLVDVGSPTAKKAGESPVGRNSTGGGSRFTEEL